MNIKSGKQRGAFVTIIMVTILIIMFIVLTASAASVIRLRRQVKAVEKHQVERLHPPPAK